jgi:hypothetical protein
MVCLLSTCAMSVMDRMTAIDGDEDSRSRTKLPPILK